jgi:arylsulfatase B
MKHWHRGSGLVTRLGNVSLVLAALGVSPLVEGCASEPLAEGTEQIGTLGVALEVAPNVTLNSVTYSITGNGFSKTGSIDVSGSPVISGTIGGIPAGNGYTITLTATSAEEGTTFTGSASFNVTAGRTTAVTIHLKGSGASGNGNVSVNGTLNVGPVIDEVTVTPLTVYVGSSVTLTGVGRDPDEAPSPLSYYWSTTGGLIDSPVEPSATLTSDTPGTFTVELTVSDGESTASQATTVTFVEREDDGSGGEGGGGGAGGGSGEGKRPNVLLLFIDDLGAESTSVYPELAGDSGAVPVPNIEALADNGLVFDNAWASPVCSPTRGTIVSGQYGHRTGVTTVGNVLPTSTVTLFDRVTADSPVNYGQAYFGKYHLGGGNSRSIDPLPTSPYPEAPGVLQHVRDLGIPIFRGILAGGISDYFNWTTYDINGPNVVTTTFATTALTDYAIDYIHQHEETRPDEPWIVYQSYNAPHAVIGGNSPFQVPPAELHSVDLSSVGNPAPGTIATNLPVYKALVQSLDTEIGRLLAEVDLENTVVIFIGDNGTPNTAKDTGTGIRSSKGSVYEGGVRVPLIVAGAGVTRRGREDDLVVTTDLYATILSLTGVPVSKVNDSYSFTPLLDDAAATNGRTHSFTEVSQGTNNRNYAIKDKRFKLLYTNRQWQLYDLVADPLEATNLIASPEHAAVLATLKEEVAVLRAEAAPGYFPE